MIAIESRMQGDHKELKILHQNCIIASRFNRKLSNKEEEHLFIQNWRKKCELSDSVKEIGRLRLHYFNGP